MPSEGAREIPHFSEASGNEDPWLVVAVQPLMLTRSFSPFQRAVHALADHHKLFRDRVARANAFVITSVNGTIVAVMPVKYVRDVVGATWAHVSLGRSDRGKRPKWTCKAAVTIGDVARLSEPDESLVVHGEAIEACVRLLRDVADEHELVITRPVYESLGVRKTGRFNVGDAALTVAPNGPVEKPLLPGADGLTGIALIGPEDPQEEPVLIVFRPSLRRCLATVEEAVRESQERIAEVLVHIRDLMRDTKGTTGSNLRFGDHVTAVNGLVDRPASPIRRLERAWSEAGSELGGYGDLDASVREVISLSHELRGQVIALRDLHRKRDDGSENWEKVLRSIDYAVTELQGAPARAVDLVVAVRNAHEERLDASA